MVSKLFTGSVLSAALGLPIAPGAADYDLRDWCEIVSDASGGSYVIFNGCMRDEAEAAAELAVMPPLSAGIARRYHDVATVATSSGGSIRTFLSCALDELQSLRDAQRARSDNVGPVP